MGNMGQSMGNMGQSMGNIGQSILDKQINAREEVNDSDIKK